MAGGLILDLQRFGCLSLPEAAPHGDGLSAVVPDSCAPAATSISGPATIRSSRSACLGSSVTSRPTTLRRFKRSSVYSASQPPGWISSSGEGGLLSPIMGLVRSRLRELNHWSSTFLPETS